MNINYNKILLVLISFFLGFFLARAIPPAVITSQAPSDSLSTVSIMLDFGDNNIVTYTDIPLTLNMSVFDVLRDLSDSDTIAIDYDDYGTNMGVLINSINGRVNGDNNSYWQYWVNNTYASVGVSNYLLKSNDVIQWKYTNQKLTNN